MKHVQQIAQQIAQGGQRQLHFPQNDNYISPEIESLVPSLNDSAAHTLSGDERRKRRIRSLVCAHAFSISRVIRIREEIDAENRRENPCRKTVRALLAEEFAETEALAASYEALLAFCDGKAHRCC